MAKKVLTPEQAEIKAMKKAKKSENWTKFWAILLAAVLTIAVVSMGQTAAEDAIAEATAGQAADGTGTNNDGSSAATEDPWNDGSIGTDAGTSTPAGDTGTSAPAGDAGSSASSGGSSVAAATAADAVKAINDATAKAAKASYTWTRDASFTKDVTIDPAMLTGAVNSIIQAVDENASLNSVVGGFLGIPSDGKAKTAQVTNGKVPAEGMAEKYLLIATTLKEAHVEKFQVNGTTYKVQLKNSTTPTGNKATAIENASNDYITVAEVNENIASFTTAISVKDTSVAEYTAIMVTAVIENGNLVSFQLDYNLAATLDLSIGAKGAGAAKISAKYTDFKY